MARILRGLLVGLLGTAWLTLSGDAGAALTSIFNAWNRFSAPQDFPTDQVPSLRSGPLFDLHIGDIQTVTDGSHGSAPGTPGVDGDSRQTHWRKTGPDSYELTSTKMLFIDGEPVGYTKIKGKLRLGPDRDMLQGTLETEIVLGPDRQTGETTFWASPSSIGALSDPSIKDSSALQY